MIPAPPGPLGLCPIESAHVSGRNFADAYVTYSTQGDTVTLHLGCGVHAETWVNIELSAERLGELLATAIESRDGRALEPAVRDVLRTLARRMS